MRERDIFIEALQLSDANRRTAYLADACGHDAALRNKVKGLLDAHERDESFFLDAPLDRLLPSDVSHPPPRQPLGTSIGPYKLLQEISEGGMGIVYMAEQRRPVERMVALKIIKPGMDSRVCLARFEAERQALALMDHPNIARVLDAGATDRGLPYFVMELVKGVSITKYCDERRLPLRERLQIIISVCQAIQHAHQKGIIHRDIKPTNVLVAQYDGRAVAKVIDFGIAKATAQKLTEKTLFTELGQLIGTLEYMSPEQAELNQLDIDTRSDVYSLGVLLYELLTGSTPFDKQKLRALALHEMLRIIREEEPETVSVRLSRTRKTGISGSEPGACGSEVNGSLPAPSHQPLVARFTELDWIVMKALEKDRGRRYDSAASLASDLERYLNDEQVRACPPTLAYRFRKFAGKHKVALFTAALVLLTLVGGAVAATWQAVRATRAERLARANEARALAEEAKAVVAAAAQAGLRQAAQQQTQIVESQRKQLEDIDRINVIVVREMLKVVGATPAKRHQSLLAALAQMSSLSGPSRVSAYHTAGNLFVTMNDYAAAHAAYDEGLKLQPRSAAIFISRGDVFFRQRSFEKAFADYTAAIECRKPNEPSNQYIPHTRRGLCYCQLGQFEQAAADIERSYEESPDLTINLLKLSFRGAGILKTPYTAGIEPIVAQLAERYVAERNNSAAAHLAMADFFAEIKQQGAAERFVQTADDAGARGWSVPYRLAHLALQANDHAAYRRVCRQAVERALAAGEDASPVDLKVIAHACALAPGALDDYAPAIMLANRALAQTPASASARFVVGVLLYRAGEYDEARRRLEECLPSTIDNQGETAYGLYVLGMCCHRLGLTDEANRWLKMGDDRFRGSEYYSWRFQACCRLYGDEAKQLCQSGLDAR